MAWYRAQQGGADARALCLADLDAWEAAASSAPGRSRFVCTPLPLHGLVRVQRQPLQDARGLFERMFALTNWPLPAPRSLSPRSTTA